MPPLPSASTITRSEKISRIFDLFDTDRDGGLSRSEMAGLVIAVNPRVKFSDEQINAILDEVFRTYEDFIKPNCGLTLEGLSRTYDDGAGDVDRDFGALSLDENSSNNFKIEVDKGESCSSSIVEERDVSAAAQREQQMQTQGLAAWTTSPNNGIAYENTWQIVNDLEISIKKLHSKQRKKEGKMRVQGENSNNNGTGTESVSDAGWSREFSQTDAAAKGIIWEESGQAFGIFTKELGVLKARADACHLREEAFDAHMALGRSLYEHQLFKYSIDCFKRACEIQPTDVRAHFRSGNGRYAVGNHAEAKEEYLLALAAAEASGNQWTYLLPQIHINLGIAMEADGMLLGACEHYREAAILSPTHFRALKLLGCALFGVGEYRAAEKALQEAVFLRSDYADAHCDLGSVLHAMGEDERAIQEFQKAIDLKPGHVDALYNLGSLHMDEGRFPRASEMYTRVLTVVPNHWKAQLNKAVSLLGAGETEDARMAFKEAFKLTKRVEVYDAIAHLKLLQKKPRIGVDYDVVEPSKFRRVGRKTCVRQELANALEIRVFQRITRLGHCDVDLMNKELAKSEVPISSSGNGVPEKSIRKASLEVILRRLLGFLKPETFQGAMKAINKRVLSVLDTSGSGRVDLGMFFAILCPICSGPIEKRKKAVFDALLLRPCNESGTQIKRTDALTYIMVLRAVYVPSHGIAGMMEVHGESDPSMVSYPEFLEMFNEKEWGFGILNTLVKLEEGDRVRHGQHTCSICRFPIIGSRFKEIKCRFSLCNQCYSEGKVPSSLKKDEYTFREYGTEAEAMKDKCVCISLNSKNIQSDA